MITIRNVRATCLVTIVAVAALGFMVGLILAFGGGGDPLERLSDSASTTEVLTDTLIGQPITVVDSLNFTITRLRWTSTFKIVAERKDLNDGGVFQLSGKYIKPSPASNRFLIVIYEMVNETDSPVIHSTLSELIHVRPADGSSITGRSLEREQWESPGFPVPPGGNPTILSANSTTTGSIYFDLDSTQEGLELISNKIGFKINIPRDDGGNGP